MTTTISDAVAAVAGELIQLANEAGLRDLAAQLVAEQQLWRAREVTLVVAGQAGSGKSALVNALLAHDVLPVGTSSTGAVYAVVRHATSPTCLVHVDPGTPPRTVALDEAPRWLTGERDSNGSPARAVEVRLDHPLLERGLVVVDTPGIGGVDAGAARLTLATLRRADALLFVTDAGAPLSEPELEFLDRATERIETVLFTLTKVDRYRGWRQVANDDMAVLARRAPRHAGQPFVPTSASLKATADELAAAGEPDTALLQESGVPTLSEVIEDRVIERAALLRVANTIRLCRFAASALGQLLAASAAASREPSAAQLESERDQAALDQLRESAERAQLVVVDRFNSLRDSAVAALAKMLREVSSRLESEGRWARSDPGALCDAVEAELRACDAELATLVDDEASRIAEEVASLVGSPALVPVATLGPLAGVELRAPVNTPNEPTDQAARLRIASVLASGGTTAAMLQGQLSMGREVAASLMGVGLLVGVVTAAAGLRHARRQREAQAVRRQLQQLLEHARTEAGPALRQHVLGLQRQVEAALKSHVREQARQLQARTNEAAKLARADVAARQKALASAERQLEALAQVSARLAALEQAVASPPPPASPRA